MHSVPTTDPTTYEHDPRCACRRLRGIVTEHDHRLLRAAHERHEKIDRHRRHRIVADRYFARYEVVA